MNILKTRGARDVGFALLAFVVLPNLTFAAVDRALMINRAWFSIDYVLLGAAWLFLPLPLRVFGFIVVTILDLIGSTAAIFNVGSYRGLAMLRWAPAPILQDSTIGALILFLVFMLNIWLAARFVCERRKLIAVVMLGIAAAFVGADALAGGSRLFGPRNANPVNFSTSTTVRFILDTRDRMRAERSDPIVMRAASDSLRRDLPGENVLFVLTESMGQPVDEALARFIWQPVTGDTALMRDYRVRTGSVIYRGGTTSGELRELCGILADYLTLPSARLPGCLPRQLADRGFETFALHGYKQRFYGRGAWYRKMFAHPILLEQMASYVPQRRCGSAFKGVCDADVLNLAAHLLRSGHPRFVYVVTLTSHLPVDVDAARDYPVAWRQISSNPVCRERKEICVEVLYWHDVVQHVAAIARERRTRVLVVGDHEPPFGRQLSASFVPGVVAFMEMVPK